MRRCVRHWKDAHPAASSVMAASATARSSANNRQPRPPLPPNSSSSNGARAEQGRAGTGRGQSPSQSEYLFASTSKNHKRKFENRLLFQGASLIEAMRRCPLSNGGLPSKRRTPQLKESRVFYFAYFPVSCPKTDAGFELSGARLPPTNRLPLLGRKPGSGGSVFPLRRCTTGVRGCPLESLA